MADQEETKEAPQLLPWKDFLADTAPSIQKTVSGLGFYDPQARTGRLQTPDIWSYCGHDKCKGYRFFVNIDRSNPQLTLRTWKDEFLKYRCRNCTTTLRIIGVRIALVEDSHYSGEAYKYGEFPAFGQDLPPRVISLVRPDRDLLIKGLRAEEQGLGVGAFAYYRRVVEHQKDNLLSEVIRVASRVGAPAETIQRLESAKAETQFRKALKDAADAIPRVLFISEQNPFSLLHSALSDNLHNNSDEECLQLAHSIRLILCELSERMADVLRENAALKDAVAKVMNSGNKPPTPPKT